MATLKTAKACLYPVTPLTVLTPFSLLLALYVLYLGFTAESPAIIYPILILPVTALVLGLYVLDRLLIKKFSSYYLLSIVELALLAGAYLFINYANSTSDIHIKTNEDYVFVLYDSPENTLERFEQKGFFSKELLVNSNILHLDSSLRYRDDLRIFPPASWKGIYENSGTYFYKGESIPYTYKLKSRQPNEYIRTQQTYIDSLLRLALEKQKN